MRDIKLHVIHCSDTPDNRDVDAATIRVWHVDGNGWDDIGYHYVIRRDGTIEEGRPTEVVGAHCPKVNRHSIGTCLVGRNNFTEAQYIALEELHARLESQFSGIGMAGHHDYDSTKTCPNFNVKEFHMKIKFNKEAAKSALKTASEKIIKPITKKRLIVLAIVVIASSFGIALPEEVVAPIIEVVTVM